MVDRYTKVVLTVIAGAMVWLCLFGLAPKWGTPAEAATTGSSGAGRYQIFFSPHRADSSFVMDTVTGRCWQVKQDTDSGVLFWDQSQYIGLSQDDSRFGLP